MPKRKLTINAEKITLDVSRPAKFPKAVIIANGAGGNMESDFISYFHKELAAKGLLTVKFNFIYQEKGKKAPDRGALLEDTYLKVLENVIEKENLKPENIILAGKSMGGRIATQIASRVKTKTIVLLGYPLHAPGRSEKLKDEHLYGLKQKLLFFSGSRDTLCDVTKMKKVTDKIKTAKLKIIEEGDHSFTVPKKSGIDQDAVFEFVLDEFYKFVK